MARVVEEGRCYKSVSGQIFGPMIFYRDSTSFGKMYIVKPGDGQVWRENGVFGILEYLPRPQPKDLIMENDPPDLTKYE